MRELAAKAHTNLKLGQRVSSGFLQSVEAAVPESAECSSQHQALDTTMGQNERGEMCCSEPRLQLVARREPYPS